jgi:AraC-like DNA-binding protein
MSDILNEITPLSEKDCFYIIERHKNEFAYPLHQHRDFELTFIEHGAGAQRVVGDSVEEIRDFDLVLIGGGDLEHSWNQGRCKSTDIREITIQFSADLFPEILLSKNQFRSISHMLDQAKMGLSFPIETIMEVYSTLTVLAGIKEKFYQYVQFMVLLYKLSISENAKVLASSSFAHSVRTVESDRVLLVKQYVNDHFTEDLTLTTLADLVGMTPSAFSRFFKTKTGRTLSDYIIDVKLGYAERMLIDSQKGVSEICYECGFNNQSNFNRIFKAKRGLTPRDFRAMYKKNKVIV